MIVRKMHPSEFDVTLNLFHYYRDEAIETVPEIEEEYDENSVIETIRLFTVNVNYCWFNLYDNQRPVGFIAGMASERLWNANIIDAHIAFVYILESHRSMDNFRFLMKKFEEWSREIGARRMTGGDIGINPERTKKLYEHFGFTPGVWLGKEIES
jgi:GNAT superfamily N-acetyltransferase